MNYLQTTCVISFFLATSLYPAATPPRSCDGAHAAASTAQADVKSALSAAHSSSDSTTILFDPTDIQRVAAEADVKEVDEKVATEIDVAEQELAYQFEIAC